MSRKSNNNNIDDWWAQGKGDVQVKGKLSRKPKKFDDDESSTEQPKAKKSRSTVAKA